jgi:charged multivesicular body protein 3
MATNKARQSVKQLANKGDVKSAKILAKEVVRSNKQKDRLTVSKARLGSINNQLQQQLGQHCLASQEESTLITLAALKKVTGSLQKSTEIMKLSNSLIKLPQLSQTMRDMSMEMTKVWYPLGLFYMIVSDFLQAGVLEEMVEETLEMEEDEALEEEADAEVDKVLFELTDGKLGEAGTVSGLPVSCLIFVLLR